MSCTDIAIPPLEDPRGDEPQYGFGPDWTENITGFSWTPVTVPQYVPPILEDITVSGDPPLIPGIGFDPIDPPYKAGTPSPILPPQLGVVPTLEATKPTIYEPTQPGDFDGTKPDGAPEVTDVEIPPAPVITLPDVPIVSDVVLPDELALNIPEFDQALPTHNVQVPDNTFSFTEEEYDSATLTNATTEILRMLAGGVGIPDTTWNLILQQGAEREEFSHVKLIDEVTKDWAARGWSAPGGVLDMRIREAEQKTHNARNTLARGITIQQSEMELNNLKYGIAQALALDGMLIQLHNSKMDRALRAGEIHVMLAIQIMQAQIEIYNADLAGYQTAAIVFKTVIEGELAKVEVYKAQIEGAKLGVDVDKARIDAYIAQVRGLSLAVELHNAQIEAVKALVSVEQAQVDAYKARIQAYAEEVRAWSIEWEGYKAAWAGQGTKADVYKTQVDAYASEVSGYGEVARAEGVRIDAEKSIITLDLERMRADVDRYIGEVQFQSARASATADIYQAQMEGYKAKIGFESTRVAVYEAKLKADVANAQVSSQAGIENARIIASQLEALQMAHTSMAETIARVDAQLAASRIGQFSTHTGLTSSLSYGHSYQCTVV